MSNDECAKYVTEEERGEEVQSQKEIEKKYIIIWAFVVNVSSIKHPVHVINSNEFRYFQNLTIFGYKSCAHRPHMNHI